MVDAGKSKSARQAILVLGMHRSGTSAIAGFISKLGAEAPKTLIPADEYNQHGYMESATLIQFNDRLLASAGSSWRDWEPFDPNWINSPLAETFAAEFPALIEAEFGDAPLFIVKDPRISLIVPFWLQQLTRLAIEPKVILTVRHPLEVAESLAKRNDFSTKISLLIWLRYMLNAESHTRSAVRTWIHFDDLLKDWRSTAGRIGNDFGMNWREPDPRVAREIDEFLTPQLQHHSSSLEALSQRPDVMEWAKTAYRVLSDRDSLYSDDRMIRATLDQIKISFDTACDIFRPLVAAEFRQAIADLERISSQLDVERTRYSSLKKEAALLKREAARRTLKGRLLKAAGWARNLAGGIFPQVERARRGLQARSRALKESGIGDPTNANEPLSDCLGRTPTSFTSYIALCAADKRFRDARPTIVSQTPPAPLLEPTGGTGLSSRVGASSPRSSQIAVVVHVYYLDLWLELAEQIAQIPAPFDLYVTIAEQNGVQAFADRIKTEYPHADVRVVPNRGRDILPFVSLLNSGALDRYPLICKLHTKRSPHRKDGDYWRGKLVFGLLGSAENVKDILRGFNANPKLGLVVANGEIYEGERGWRSNRARCQELTESLGLRLNDYPARFAGGSIFWSRGSALKPLKTLALSADAFEPEDGAVDGTTAHAIERLFSIFAMAEGFSVVERSRI